MTSSIAEVSEMETEAEAGAGTEVLWRTLVNSKTDFGRNT